MDLYLDDDAFVRAPPALVYAQLIEFDAYDRWWPGLSVVRAAPAGDRWDSEMADRVDPLVGFPRDPGDSRFDVHIRVGRRRSGLRLHVRPYRFRPASGVLLDVTGDITGTAEWWLEDGYGGTVVHHLARGGVSRGRPSSATARYRLAVRSGLFGLKDAVQSQVREALGLVP
ncbi:MAG: hypothetical protein KY462_01995 [Actinobacteria bacterium]|nr:hypothetical protein [Actinomycetota bacterium]